MQLPEYLLSLLNYVKKKRPNNFDCSNHSKNFTMVAQSDKVEPSRANFNDNQKVVTTYDGVNRRIHYIIERIDNLESTLKYQTRKFEELTS